MAAATDWLLLQRVAGYKRRGGVAGWWVWIATTTRGGSGTHEWGFRDASHHPAFRAFKRGLGGLKQVVAGHFHGVNGSHNCGSIRHHV